ncbi:MAG TPA: DUF4337 family protein [Thermoanaerobaculia bacterium]|jgi:hypothetical protein|nr:DUF4337 family protein [Thermoanaerobaculia bacterium]
MSEAHEALERAEHAAHSGGHEDHGGHKGSAKLIGLTMALIGVLIALCAAMVGSERNELTRAMIMQTQAHSDYTSASTKFRLVMLDLENLHGAQAAPGAQPSPVLERFIRLYMDYSTERTLSKTWADSYEPLVEAHFEAAEGYEKAQLIAEIGIVIASLGVLLASRTAWIISILIAALSVGQLGRTLVHTRSSVGSDNVKVEKAEEAYQNLRKAHTGANEDEKTVDQLDPGGKIRTALDEKMKAANAAAGHGEGEEKKKEEK